MKVVVAVKRVIDHNIRVRPTADGQAVDTAGVKMSINPFDEHAVEEAVRLKEAGIASEVVVVTLGTAQHQDVLRHALALGADRAILIESEASVSSRVVAKALLEIVKREAPDLVLVGKQAIDDDAAEVGQMLAAFWHVGQATFASKISISDGKALVVREIDGGQETLSLALPAVVSVDLRINEPRYLKLPNLMQAKKKPLATLALGELGIDTQSTLTTLKIAEPPARARGIRVANVQELLEKLRHEARAL
jgi:electron transfer flavoprotein beta subunit